MKKYCLLLLSLLILSPAFAQDKDKAILTDYPPSFYRNTIMKELREFESAQKEQNKRKNFTIDVSGMDLPIDPAAYKSIWHTKPVSQGNTGTCWCYSTTSFFESEIQRLSGNETKLSEMYVVYWEYVERARYFVQNRGNMHLGEGSETNAVAKLYKKYGAVPYEAYTGNPKGQPFPNHAPMYKEIEDYLHSVKKLNSWNEAEVIATTRSILDHYLGAPPTKFKVKGKEMTPLEYLNKELKLKPEEYVDFMSLMDTPYWTQGEYRVPDNWWHSKDYYNVPLDDFVSGLRGAIDKGYGISIGGDVSEAGIVRSKQVAMVPSFDIPSEYIDEAARYFRFRNGSTTDDHAMHLVGYQEVDGEYWYLIKDSGAGSRTCGEGCKGFGYQFFHEDFIKLKMMSMTVHKDAVKDILKKFEVQ